MISVSRSLGLDDFIASLAHGYDSRVGTGGLRLSAGIQQKIGIARALLSEPDILIIDEAVAPLDPESADEANRAILEAMSGRTCLMIVHRVLMATECDSVLVMDDGRAVESGSPESLLRRPQGLYRRIFRMQYGEDRLPPVGEE
jgi:ATP-binding cassette subfamily B protein